MNQNPNDLLAGSPGKLTRRGDDAMALRGLVDMMNNPDPAGLNIVNGDTPVSRADIPTDVGAEMAAMPPAPVPVEPPPPKPSYIVPSRTFFTGKLAVGKDFVANQIGAPIFGFADPIYYLATFFFGVEVTADKNKDLPGMRKFLQVVGQWGRGEITTDYPYTTERAMFCLMIRSLAKSFDQRHKVDWKNYGLTNSLWVDSMIARTDEFLASATNPRVANTNVRFEVEYKKLTEQGWDHWHVMCSPQTWANRLAAKKIAQNSPVLNDISEKLAQSLDNAATREISRSPRGPKLKVIWNDHVPPPSQRFWSLPEFSEAVLHSDAH